VFSKAFEASELAGLGYKVRLHLHPDVDPQIDLGGRAVSLTLKSGEIWLLRFDSTCQMQLENSVYLETGRLHPRATKQIVLSQRAIEYASRISWSLSKAHDTAVAVRDVHLDVTAAG
ncbi:MAG: heparinase II/III family protein, partial [Paracoccaceae bacterium]|nr:heparinase II/III family protein [Paracoccaceae bacterium]